MTTRVYQYRVLPLGNCAQRREVLDHPELIAQLRLNHELRNAMVAAERALEEDEAALKRTHSEVAAAEQTLADAEKVVVDLIATARREHTATRSLKTSRTTSKAIAAARRDVRAARAISREANRVAKAALAPLIAERRKQRDADIKALYAEFVQERGLHWATYNLARKQHMTAVSNVVRLRSAGMPAQLRFHRWDGSGTMAVQLQRGSDQPVRRTPDVVADDHGPWHNSFHMPWQHPDEWSKLARGQRRKAGRVNARIYIGNKRWVTVPVQAHRPVPADAEVVLVTLTRTVTAGQPRMHLCLTTQAPSPEPVEGPAVALHLGWRTRPDGGTRVATYSSPTHLPPVPVDLAGIVVPHDTGRSGEVVIPDDWHPRVDPDGIRSVRDKDREPVQAMIAEWLDTNPQPDPSDEDPDRCLTGARVRQWRSPARLAALAIRWRATTPHGPDADRIAAQLEQWRRRDKHLWLFEAHVRARMVRRRRDLYARISAWLTSAVGMLVVDDTDLRELRRTEDPATEDPALPGTVQRRVRNRAATVAPGMLRARAVCTATLRGVTVNTVKAAGLSRTHHTCGHTTPADGQHIASAAVICAGCGNAYDQDYNAVRIMLDRAHEEAPQPAA